MPKIRDVAITINTVATSSMVMEMPEHEAGDLLLAFLNKDSTGGWTQATWTSIQAGNSAGAATACWAKRATSSSETVTFGLTLETCMGVVVAIKGCYGTTVADAISNSGLGSAIGAVVPSGGTLAHTPGHDNSLIFAWNSGDIGHSPMYLPGWVNIFGGDAGANGGALSYTWQKTAAQVYSPGVWCGIVTGIDTREIIVSVRDDGNNTEVDAYLDRATVPTKLLSPLSMIAVVDRGTWAASALTYSSIGGKTTAFDAAASVGDAGYNPYRAVTSCTPSASTTLIGGPEFIFSSAEDLTWGCGCIFGSWRFTVPRDYVDCGFVKHGGLILYMGTNASNYRAWMIGAQGDKVTKADGRNFYTIQVGNADTIFGSNGSPSLSAIQRFGWMCAGYYAATVWQLSDLWLLNKAVMAGGRPSNPFDFLELENAVNNGCGYVPLFQRAGSAATYFIPLQFGGGEPCHVEISLRTFQLPKRADEVDYLNFHVADDTMGFEFYGQDRGSGDVDTLHFIGCVFTADQSYYWRFNANHASGADIDFTGSTVVGANVTLQSTVTLDGVAFTNCTAFALNSATLSGITFLNTKVMAASPAAVEGITSSAFTSIGTGYAIEIGGTAADITLTDLNFSGYAAEDGSTGNEAIYVNISDGSMSITIDGGSTPSVRSAGCTVTVITGQAILAFNVKNTAGSSVTGYEWRLYEDDPTPGILGITELDGEETAASASQSYSYTYVDDVDVVLQILHDDYQEFVWSGTLSVENQTVGVILQLEQNV